MKKISIISIALSICLSFGCNENKMAEKGFPVQASEEQQQEGMNDSLKIETRTTDVLMTTIPSIRLAAVYMVNTIQKTGEKFTGSNSFHYNYSEESYGFGNQWNNHLMPGFEALYGYNLVNMEHYNVKQNKSTKFFEKSVLIRTFYYPAFSKDTLNSKPIERNYFLVSAYDVDSNKDGVLNLKDLRKLYYFDINGSSKTQLIPSNYSVYKSQYDSANDFLYVYAKEDTNGNGAIEKEECSTTFYLDLNNPLQSVKMFE